ncbi:MAG: ATP-binding protein [Chloroflexota bacterium]
MNKLWIRLSFAFFGIMTATVVIIFSTFFALSWLAPAPFTPEEFVYDYADFAEPFIETLIIQGQSDQEIIKVLADEARVRTIVQEKRTAGFAPDVDIENRSFGRIFSDYLVELSDPINIQIVLIGTLIGIIANVFVSRQLTRPLAQLTHASQALGQRDLTQRVTVQGSEEINKLVTTFNEMAQQLEQAEQTRQNMLADVSHELRTPLAGLEGTLRATLDGVFALDNHQVSNLYTQTQHLTRLVDDLHLLARTEAQRLTLDLTEVDITALLHDLADTFSLLVQAVNVTLDCKLEQALVIHADAVRIRQIVSNLLNNALHHTPSGGTITLALRQDGMTVEISIRDTGKGIAPNHLPHLFDRFYRVDASRSRDTGGTGLGLAITKALVEAHQGTITVDSDGLGQGAMFTVVLPLNRQGKGL